MKNQENNEKIEIKVIAENPATEGHTEVLEGVKEEINTKVKAVKKKSKIAPLKKDKLVLKKPTDKLLEIAKEYSGFEYYEKELITKKMCAFLAVFEKNLGNISHALRSIDTKSRDTYKNWRSKNEYFDMLCEDIKEAQIDVVESKLQKNILEGNLIAQMFYLKTIGKNRGYTERAEIESKIEVVGFEFVEAKEED